MQSQNPIIKPKIEYFILSKTTEDRKIVIDTPGEYSFFFLFSQVQGSIEIVVAAEQAKVKCAVLVDSSIDSEGTVSGVSDASSVSGQTGLERAGNLLFSATIQASFSSADISLVSFLTDNAKANVQGQISLAEGIQDAEGYLFEDILVLGKKTTIKTAPMLLVGSHNVKASHGASIQRLDPQKLFYMQAKGLSTKESASIYLQSYIQKMLDFADITEDIMKNEPHLQENIEKMRQNLQKTQFGI